MDKLNVCVYFTSKENIKLHSNAQKSDRWRSKQKLAEDVKTIIHWLIPWSRDTVFLISMQRQSKLRDHVISDDG